MKISRGGFIAPLLLALVTVLAIGGGAYVYLQKKQVNQPTISPSAQATSLSVTSHDIINSVYIKNNAELLFTDDANKTWTVNYQNATGGMHSRSGDFETLQAWLLTRKHVGDAPTVFDINGAPPGAIRITGVLDSNGILIASSIEVYGG